MGPDASDENPTSAPDIFRENTIVRTVERVLDVHHTVDSESGEQVPCSNDHCGKFKWEVRGQEVKVDDVG